MTGPKKKKPYGPKKGGDFERLICRKLSLFVTGGRNDSVFWRSANSGGRATRMMKGGKVNLHQSGDLTAISEEAYPWCAKFYFELKCYRDLQIVPSLLKRKGILLSFWTDTVEKAAKYSKRPVLICHQDLCPDFLVCSSEFGEGPAFLGSPILQFSSWPQGPALFLFDQAASFTALRRRRKM